MNQLEQKLAKYQPAARTVEIIKQSKIVFLVGPAGAGKDAIKSRLLATGEYQDIVSHTTRPPRINQGTPERDGIDYHFISLEQAEKMIDEQAFVEVNMYSNNIYGTAAQEIAHAHDAHKIAITDIEVQGVAEYMAIDHNVLAAFILPPSFEVWQSRLQKRYGETMEADDYYRRMSTAASELEQFLSRDYYWGIINESIDEAAAMVQRLVADKKFDQHTITSTRKTATDLLDRIRKTLGIT